MIDSYASALSTKLAFFGFTYNPLSRGDIESLCLSNVSLDDAYGIACDVAAGFSIEESVAAMFA